MSINETQEKMELAELANKLFMYTDLQQWEALLEEVFSTHVWFDMKSAGGGEPASIPATDICDMWRQGFATLDAVHHQAGQYLITLKADEAAIFAYAVATHYKQNAIKGKTRAFVGSYDLKAARMKEGWRIIRFKYNLKYIDGNATLE